MSASTRRAAIGAILAAPLASVPVVALTANIPSDLSDLEARFIALAPRLVPLLDEYDRLRLLWNEPYAAWEKARETGKRHWKPSDEKLPEYQTYLKVREPADEIDRICEQMYDPYHDLRLVSFEAIKLRHRFGMTFDWARDDLLDDLDAIWGREACA
ncbi:hypothetical protein [Methylobacterium sp.]|uniref:hypothetical protein n=1 Tax=Methylobacterium sp. TaxID=409 RepID=UPI003B007677